MEVQHSKTMKTSISTATAESLPEEIMQHIQSFLPFNEAARTMVVSKPWHRAWSTNPTLRFHQPSSHAALKLKFMNLVDQTLKRYHLNNIKIESFSLFVRDKISASVLKTWLDLLINKINGLKQLTLCIYFTDHVSCQLLSEIFFSKTLKKLKLDASGTSEKRLLLSFHHIINFRSLDVLELSNASLVPGNLYNSNDDFRSGNLKHLQLTSVVIDDDVLEQLIRRLPFLETLEIKNCDSLQKINIDSVPLKNLSLISSWVLSDVTVSAPKLDVFYYEGVVQDATLSLSGVAPAQLRTTVRPYSHMHIVDTSYFLWLQEYFMRSRRLTIYIDVYDLESRNIDLQHLRDVSFSQRKNVEILTLKLWSGNIASSTLLDAFFSICHPKFLRILLQGTVSDTSFNKFFSTALKSQKKIECCNFDSRIICWRHYLKRVEYGYTRKSKDEDSWESSVQWRNRVMDGPSNCLKLTWF